MLQPTGRQSFYLIFASSVDIAPRSIGLFHPGGDIMMYFAPSMKSFEELRIVFFGTPDFAVASLAALVNAGANVVAVVTAPDKPAGRGRHMQASAVKQYAESKHLPVLQPEKMKAPDFLESLGALAADLQVVVAFRMMPEVVWNMPPMGTVNVHGSLLPQYRGAAPINRAIMNGDTVTGVTTFRLKHEIDTGDILLQKEVPILPQDNAGAMHDKLMEAGAALLVETVRGLAAGTLKEIPQAAIAEADLRKAPKIFRDDMLINWDAPVRHIQNQVRGLSPYPAAFTELGGKVLKIYASHFVDEIPGISPGDPASEKDAFLRFAPPGTVDTDHTTYLRFAAQYGWLYADEVQQEGKKRMLIADFLRGYRG